MSVPPRISYSFTPFSSFTPGTNQPRRRTTPFSPPGLSQPRTTRHQARLRRPAATFSSYKRSGRRGAARGRAAGTAPHAAPRSGAPCPPSPSRRQSREGPERGPRLTHPRGRAAAAISYLPRREAARRVPPLQAASHCAAAAAICPPPPRCPRLSGSSIHLGPRAAASPCLPPPLPYAAGPTQTEHLPRPSRPYQRGPPNARDASPLREFRPAQLARSPSPRCERSRAIGGGRRVKGERFTDRPIRSRDTAAAGEPPGGPGAHVCVPSPPPAGAPRGSRTRLLRPPLPAPALRMRAGGARARGRRWRSAEAKGGSRHFGGVGGGWGRAVVLGL